MLKNETKSSTNDETTQSLEPVNVQLSEEELLAQQIMLEKDQMIIKLEKKVNDLTTRSLKVFEKNQELQTSPELIAKTAQLDYELKIAKQFSESKAFPSSSPEQIYVLMKAGEEMGLSPIVSLNMLYVVNGHIGPYGDKMLGHILSQGYSVRYEDEEDDIEVTAIITHVESGTEYKEKATCEDQIIKKSKIKGAGSFALKNKMRFHAIRMIASFHLPHLFMGCSDTFTKDFNEWQDENEISITDKSGNTVVKVDDKVLFMMIKDCEDLDELNQIESENKAKITKNIKIASQLSKTKERLSNIENQES